MIRRILFIIMVLVSAGARASVTKVGNGDDGGDLEALTLIKGGPLLETRVLAVNRVKALNVAGIPGLGQLIPELERSDMMMAAQDSHPTGETAGTLEISDDKSLVYARTFAEPYAVTRFFPAALTLTAEQMIALHIHEALHRSLPANIRENENVVMHITMALTSPGANFDRVWQVTRLYVRNAPVVADLEGEGTPTHSSVMREPRVLPKASLSKFGYQVESFATAKNSPAYYGYQPAEVWHGIEFAGSLGGYRSIGSVAVEPYFGARMKMASQFGGLSTFGPSSYDLSARISDGGSSITAPFVRFSAKSLDGFGYGVADRDIWTLGILHQRESYRAYLDAQFFYSFGSTSKQDHLSRVDYKPILSMSAHGGWVLRRFRLGGIAAVHASEGYTMKGLWSENGVYYSNNYNLDREAFRLLVLGPEIAFTGSRFKLTLAYQEVMNGYGSQNLASLGDVMDRGVGTGGVAFNGTLYF